MTHKYTVHFSFMFLKWYVCSFEKQSIIFMQAVAQSIVLVNMLTWLLHSHLATNKPPAHTQYQDVAH